MAAIDVTEATFATEVIERSRQLPVVVDFWAAWCGPCRALGPTLESVAADRDGKVVLAKLDTEANPNLARTHEIRSIPAVKAFRDGLVVDEFLGVQPPVAVERFFDRLIPSEADALVSGGDEPSLRRALELEPGRADAAVPLARLLLGREQATQALEVLQPVVGSFQADGLAARIRLQHSDAIAPELAEGLRSALAALDQGETRTALDALLALLPHADGHRDDMRRVVVGELDVLGAHDPLAREARRRLAAALY